MPSKISYTAAQAAAGKTLLVQTAQRGTLKGNIGFAVTLAASSNLTYKVSATYDNLDVRVPVTIARTTTVATVTLIDHGLTTADVAIISAAGAPFDGQWPVASVVDANTFTFTVANSGATADTGTATLTKVRLVDHQVAAAKTTAWADVFNTYPTGILLNVTAYTAGKATLVVSQEIQ